MTEKLAYIVYLIRIAEEKRMAEDYGIEISLGDKESDWRRAEEIIDFFSSPPKDTLAWHSKLDDLIKYKAIYERLKFENSVA
jgi:hypothetical protein